MGAAMATGAATTTAPCFDGRREADGRRDGEARRDDDGRRDGEARRDDDGRVGEAGASR